MKRKMLPSLRALQTFEVFGRTNSVADTARELNVTPGAVSQQLKILEEQIGKSLITRRGRGVLLRKEAEAYHKFLSEGFDALHRAQIYLDRMEQATNLSVSALPSLLSKWLYPILGNFQDQHPGVSIRLDSTHQEPERYLLSTTFRLTYGDQGQIFPFHKELFTDSVFPVCSPEFLQAYPEVKTTEGLRQVPLLRTDWGPGFEDVPGWEDWFDFAGITDGEEFRDVGVFSLSSMALDAAIQGKGVALAQTSFAERDLQTGRLIRLSDEELKMPHPYIICWGEGTLHDRTATQFLDWILQAGRQISRSMRRVPGSD
ncbi:LysR substrate-binding domain-containing protein [Ruegeria sp.]|uniref:LysR substrate-binding domain-containing protein n=1 Tax=Ruegeria sp. TaxID=1879320 RepID=UPI003C7C704B